MVTTEIPVVAMDTGIVNAKMSTITATTIIICCNHDGSLWFKSIFIVAMEILQNSF